MTVEEAWLLADPESALGMLMRWAGWHERIQEEAWEGLLSPDGRR